MAIAAHQTFRNGFASEHNRSGYYSPYLTETHATESITLKGWEDITNWRTDNPGNGWVKAVAELGYLMNGLFGIAETAVRLPVCFLVGNPLSKLIAEGSSALAEDPEILASYRRVRATCNESFDKCVQGVAQNFTSVGTNLASQNCNLSTSREVAVVVRGEGRGLLEIIQRINPVSIVWAAIRGDPRGLIDDITERPGVLGLVRDLRYC